MTRLLGLLSLLVALAVGGWLLTVQLGSAGADGSGGLTATQAAADTAAAAALGQAALAMEAVRAQTGTYGGAAPGVAGVVVVRADVASYCLQAGALHVAGPGGAATAGPC
ncbi:MAG: hypothetical protein ACM33B_00255 [Pseudomonadota bacterium]